MVEDLREVRHVNADKLHAVLAVTESHELDGDVAFGANVLRFAARKGVEAVLVPAETGLGTALAYGIVLGGREDRGKGECDGGADGCGRDGGGRGS